MSTRPSMRRTSTMKSPPPMARTQSTRDVARKSTGGIFASFFAKPASRTPVPVAHKETPMFVIRKIPPFIWLICAGLTASSA